MMYSTAAFFTVQVSRHSTAHNKCNFTPARTNSRLRPSLRRLSRPSHYGTTALIPKYPMYRRGQYGWHQPTCTTIFVWQHLHRASLQRDKRFSRRYEVTDRRTDRSPHKAPMDVPVGAGLSCHKTAVLGETIKGTPCIFVKTVLA
jgi:hypothetical protein